MNIDELLRPTADFIFNIVMYPISITDTIDVPIVVIVLILAAAYFTLYFKFPNARYFKLAIQVVRGKVSPAETDSKSPNMVDGDNPDTIRIEGQEGEVTAFQALTAALSATVGLGNISGVALAIAAGGPGATFWMILAGFLGMASKFTECTLGVKYREVGDDGVVYGGPMYYLKKGLASRGLVGLGKVLGIFYAIMMVGGSFGAGNMFQANQAASQFLNVTNLGGSEWGTWAFGIVTAILVGIVIIGGIKRIGKVAERVVPTMVGIYVLAALIIIFANIPVLPQAFSLILDGAFTPGGVGGGFLGVLIIGFQRAAFSSEAGVGSASVAHSAVKTKYPGSEGIVALLEPFIDTVVVCTMTALVIIITNIDGGFLTYGSEDGLNGVLLTSTAFNSVIPGFSYILAGAVILFAFSTMLSWSYYGLQAWKFLFGRTQAVDLIFKTLFCIFVVIGSTSSLGSVIKFSDAMVFAMIIPNTIGLIILAPVVRVEVKRYVAAVRRGEKV